MYAAPFYPQTRNQDMLPTVKADSTTSSSVFSSNEMDYASQVREMEEYYLKTLLTEDDENDIAYTTKLQQPSNTDDIFSNDSTSTGSPSSPRQIAKLNSFYNPFLTEQSTTTTTYNQYYTSNTAVSNSLHNKSLEVDINNAFNPAVSSLPLTTENLQRLGQNSQSNQHLAQQQLKMLQSQFVDTSVTGQHQHQHNRIVHNDSSEQQVNKQLYKTELCESFTTKGHCKYGNKCQFAHGLEELKLKERRSNFRTKPCVNWAKLGYCPYGKRCCFKHGSDRDIQIYVNAGAIKVNDQTGEKVMESDTATKPTPCRPKHLHPNVKLLQRISW
ncbi:similar to Saccharomyces cerevisiae YDR151C CTH1 Member of the CCCH zinc finger family [Maudiozyma barnettii]|uniref:Similar to Saccharomyces cerevisiae YDR151C CTH1 Member of the CCCH zinc finger family n=1 Tax=Maudiozyma barnettii TaxID=61262 RepID=A0A8H2ZJ64_9SACH|nr:putative mRNA-binding protein CTH1 [Kazachstania barnettii]CAB4255678.1 similar to Saccharomyces cerevisiae YDR151C CTH1 Member of the CCCH zinc finger family [Kazachstania barnettii]CAD1784239.1 similar to Saccharomyces cerevisiae YDR151C CTH1 Member of the CCCH zinc finger family [Kazachstania barnettii]